jgi:hypothetical protein
MVKLSDKALLVSDEAERIALQSHYTVVGTKEILMALVSTPCAAATILGKLGVTQAKIQEVSKIFS